MHATSSELSEQAAKSIVQSVFKANAYFSSLKIPDQKKVDELIAKIEQNNAKTDAATEKLITETNQKEKLKKKRLQKKEEELLAKTVKEQEKEGVEKIIKQKEVVAENTKRDIRFMNNIDPDTKRELERALELTYMGTPITQKAYDLVNNLNRGQAKMLDDSKRS